MVFLVNLRHRRISRCLDFGVDGGDDGAPIGRLAPSLNGARHGAALRVDQGFARAGRARQGVVPRLFHAVHAAPGTRGEADQLGRELAHRVVAARRGFELDVGPKRFARGAPGASLFLLRPHGLAQLLGLVFRDVARQNNVMIGAAVGALGFVEERAVFFYLAADGIG